MGRRKKEVSREVTEPVLDFALENPKHVLRLFVLGKNETFKLPHGKRDVFAVGPSLVYQSFMGGAFETVEHDVNDPVTWAWIGELINDGRFTGKVKSNTNQQQAAQARDALREAHAATPELTDEELSEALLEEVENVLYEASDVFESGSPRLAKFLNDVKARLRDFERHNL